MKSLTNSSACDIYGLSDKTIKLIKDAILLPMELIINMSFESVCFATKLKCTKIRTVYKKENINDLNSHRSISIVSPLSKIIEAALNNMLIKVKEFRKRKSTIQAITKLVTEILPAVEKDETLLRVFLDLSKTFDGLSHPITYRQVRRLWYKENFT